MVVYNKASTNCYDFTPEPGLILTSFDPCYEKELRGAFSCFFCPPSFSFFLPVSHMVCISLMSLRFLAPGLQLFLVGVMSDLFDGTFAMALHDNGSIFDHARIRTSKAPDPIDLHHQLMALQEKLPTWKLKTTTSNHASATNNNFSPYTNSKTIKSVLHLTQIQTVDLFNLKTAVLPLKVKLPSYYRRSKIPFVNSAMKSGSLKSLLFP